MSQQIQEGAGLYLGFWSASLLSLLGFGDEGGLGVGWGRGSAFSSTFDLSPSPPRALPLSASPVQGDTMSPAIPACFVLFYFCSFCLLFKCHAVIHSPKPTFSKQGRKEEKERKKEGRKEIKKESERKKEKERKRRNTPPQTNRRSLGIRARGGG